MLADEQMRALYQSASHYISLSFGEGWDLAMMEAACAGLHLIAPSHSAYCSYLSDRDADMIPACPVPAVPEGRAGAEDRVFFDGLTWWRPDEDAAVDVIQGIIGGSAAPKPSPQARIIREYSWENAGGHLLEILNGL
jgi:glycosyltransferase involved in cell wall biosynthesis